MDLQDLLAPVVGEPNIPDALASWDWLVPAGVRPLIATALGDLFTIGTDGSVSYLDLVNGTFAVVAESTAAWEQLLRDEEFVERHLSPGFVILLRERIGILAQGECYVPKLEPVFGGSWEPDNWSRGSWTSHLERQGRVHLAIKDLPNGTKFSEWKYTEL